MPNDIVHEENACPINGITELLSRKWVFGIVKDIFSGKKHFNEFKEGKPEMSNASLSNTLKYLESQRIIVKNVFEDDSQAVTEYHLTDKGLKINRMLYEIVLYGLYVLEDDLRSDEYKEEIKQAYEEILGIDD